MSNLPGKLGDYVTVAMAVGLLGYNKEQTGRFYALVKRGLPIYKVGGMTLAKFAELAQHAGLPAGTSPPWPAALAELDMADLYSRSAAAEALSVSPRTVNRQANAGAIASVDLGPWGGYTLYKLGEVVAVPEYIAVGHWMLEATMDKGRLHLVLTNKAYDDLWVESSASYPPRMTFVHKDRSSPPVASLRVASRHDS